VRVLKPGQLQMPRFVRAGEPNSTRIYNLSPGLHQTRSILIDLDRLYWTLPDGKRGFPVLRWFSDREISDPHQILTLLFCPF
jgi:hypothetical protein